MKVKRLHAAAMAYAAARLKVLSTGDHDDRVLFLRAEVKLCKAALALAPQGDDCVKNRGKKG